MIDVYILFIFYIRFSALLTSLSALFLGLFVYFKDTNNQKYRSLFIHCTPTVIWGAGYFMWQISTNPQHALFYCRVLMIGTTFMPATFLHFILELLDKNKGPMKKILFIGYAIALFVLSFAFSPLYVAGVEKKLFFEFWPMPGRLFFIFLAYFASYWILAFVVFSKDYRRSQGTQRAHLKIILQGIILGYIGGIPNFFLWYNIPIPPFTIIFVSVYTMILSYATLKYGHLESRHYDLR